MASLKRYEQLNIFYTFFNKKKSIKKCIIFNITTSINIIQRFQKKVLRGIVMAIWYIRNADIHGDLKVNTVAKEIRFQAEAHYKRHNELVRIVRRESSW